MTTALFVIALGFAVWVVWRLGTPPATSGSGRSERRAGVVCRRPRRRRRRHANLKEILLAPFVLVVALVVGLVLGLVDGVVSGFKKPPPRRTSSPDALCCGGVAGGCPVCLAIGVAGGVLLGSWLEGE